MKNVVYFLLTAFVLNACEERPAPLWERIDTPVTHKLQAIAQAGDSVWWIAGGIRYGAESLFKTLDRGQNWEVEPMFFGQTWFDGSFLNSQEGYFCGISGKVLRTLDGGQNWLLSQIPFWLPMRSITATPDVVLSVGGVAYDRGIIARSEDQGLTWQIVDTTVVELRDVLFVTEQTAYACGFGTILRSEDAGLTWDLLPVQGEFFTAMSFPTESLGFAVGRTGTIMRTQDGGDSWATLRNGDALGKAPHFYNQIVFWDEDIGYIVGDKGLILQTPDKGEHWVRLINETQEDLYDVMLTGPQQGFVVGDKGCLLQFSF